jgi:hypothetical protein
VEITKAGTVSLSYRVSESEQTTPPTFPVTFRVTRNEVPQPETVLTLTRDGQVVLRTSAGQTAQLESGTYLAKWKDGTSFQQSFMVNGPTEVTLEYQTPSQWSTYQLTVLHSSGSPAAMKSVSFRTDEGVEERFRSDQHGIIAARLPSNGPVTAVVDEQTMTLSGPGSHTMILEAKTYLITFLVTLDGQPSYEGNILVQDIARDTREVVRPGSSLKLSQGEYRASYQNGNIRSTKSFRVHQTQSIVMEVYIDWQSLYSSYYLNRNEPLLKKEVNESSGNPSGYRYFLARYYLAKTLLEKTPVKYEEAKVVFDDLINKYDQWIKLRIKPEYILYYLQCLENNLDRYEKEMNRAVTRPDIISSFNHLSGDIIEQQWKFQFYYYRITVLYRTYLKRTGRQQEKQAEMIQETFSWVDQIPGSIKNSFPEMGASLLDIRQRLNMTP